MLSATPLQSLIAGYAEVPVSVAGTDLEALNEQYMQIVRYGTQVSVRFITRSMVYVPGLAFDDFPQGSCSLTRSSLDRTSSGSVLPESSW